MIAIIIDICLTRCCHYYPDHSRQHNNPCAFLITIILIIDSMIILGIVFWLVISVVERASRRRQTFYKISIQTMIIVLIMIISIRISIILLPQVDEVLMILTSL